MTKAILVIDEMPLVCSKCKFFDESYNIKDNKVTWYCHVIDDVLTCQVDCGRYIKCPLKPMPEKKPIRQDRGINHCEYSLLDRLEYQKGFNDCVNEILGEDNGSR